MNLPSTEIKSLAVGKGYMEEMSELRIHLATLRECRKNLLIEMEQTSCSLRCTCPELIQENDRLESEILSLQSELEDITGSDHSDDPEEELTPEQKQTLKERKKKAKLMYRRIANLCHPDKTKGMAEEKRKALSDILVEAKEGCKHGAVEYLVELHNTLLGVYDGSIEAVDDFRENHLQELRTAVSAALFAFEQLQRERMYKIHTDLAAGKYFDARMLYSDLVSDNIANRNAHVRRLQYLIKEAKEFANEQE